MERKLGINRDGFFMDKPQELALGEKITVQTVPGREGKAIGRFPDGRVILFDQNSQYSSVIAPGQSVECHVIFIQEKYVIVTPISEPIKMEATPVPRVDVDKVLEDLVGETSRIDLDKIVEDLEKLVGEVPKKSKVIPRALIHVIWLERLIIRILADYVSTRSKS